MKIAFLSREYPPDTLWGGEAIVYHTLARALAERGHEVHVICQAVDRPKDLVEEGVFVHRVGTNARQHSAIARINYSFHAWRKLRQVIKKYGVEIVEASYWSAEGFPYCLKKQVPLIVKTQSFPRDQIRTKNYHGFIELVSLKILSRLADFVARRADRIISNSKANCERVVKELGIKPGKLDIVHHAIDVAKFRPTETAIRENVSISPQTPLVLFIGRLEARKGCFFLCQAIPEVIKNYPDTRFILVGRDTNSAPGGASFKNYIMAQGEMYNFRDNLIFIEFLPEDELIQLYSACDVFVLPSLHESFGLPTLEAMACGKPVVATSTGVVPELEPYGLKGLEIVPVGDSLKLAQAITKFLSLGEEGKKQIARENREFVEAKFSISAWIDRVVDVYNQTLNRAAQVRKYER